MVRLPELWNMSSKNPQKSDKHEYIHYLKKNYPHMILVFSIDFWLTFLTPNRSQVHPSPSHHPVVDAPPPMASRCKSMMQWISPIDTSW